MEQRFIELTFSASGTQLCACRRRRARPIAPPGFYLLFVLDSAGRAVGRARSCRISVAGNPNPAITPTLDEPRQPAGHGRHAASACSWRPRTRTATRSTYWRQRPAAGPVAQRDDRRDQRHARPRPATTTSSSRRATASTSTSRASSGPITNGAPLTLAPLAPPPPVLAGAGSDLHAPAPATASTCVVPVGLRRRHAARAGRPARPSPTPSPRPGIYYVTVTANDDRGVAGEPQRRADRAPAADRRAPDRVLRHSRSSRAPTGNARLWVVNQDNDSVSVFDAVTNAQAGRDRVGIAPRSARDRARTAGSG